MNCLTCNTKMICVDDTNGAPIKIDWLECPKCKSSAEVTYDSQGNKDTVIWKR